MLSIARYGGAGWWGWSTSGQRAGEWLAVEGDVIYFGSAYFGSAYFGLMD